MLKGSQQHIRPLSRGLPLPHSHGVAPPQEVGQEDVGAALPGAVRLALGQQQLLAEPQGWDLWGSSDALASMSCPPEPAGAWTGNHAVSTACLQLAQGHSGH